jgi:hypothetical protein
MKKIIKLTESDLTRIVKRVIVEQTNVPQKCINKDLKLIPEIFQRNGDLTLIFNEIASNVVTVISKDAKINCGCKKDELMQYLK